MKRILSVILIALLAISVAGCKCNSKAGVDPNHAQFQAGQLVYDITLCQQYYIIDTDVLHDQYDVRDKNGKVWGLPFSSAGKSKTDCVHWDTPETSPMPNPDEPPTGSNTDGGP